MDKVQPDPVHGGPKLREAVDGRLLGSPVEAGLPPADQLLQERRAGAVLPASPVQLPWPAGAGQPRIKVVQGAWDTSTANRSTPTTPSFIVAGRPAVNASSATPASRNSSPTCSPTASC